MEVLYREGKKIFAVGQADNHVLRQVAPLYLGQTWKDKQDKRLSRIMTVFSGNGARFFFLGADIQKAATARKKPVLSPCTTLADLLQPAPSRHAGGRLAELGPLEVIRIIREAI
jgi:hypothetical protein